MRFKIVDTNGRSKTAPKGFAHLLKEAFDLSPRSSSKHPVVSVSNRVDQTAPHVHEDVPHFFCHSAAQRQSGSRSVTLGDHGLNVEQLQIGLTLLPR